MSFEAKGVRVVNGQLPKPAAPQLSKAADPLGQFTAEAATISKAKQFALAAGPRLAWTVLMHVGTPAIAVTAPALLEKFGGDLKNNVPANLIAGSAMGGAWGAVVGAMIPVNYAGIRVPRAQAIGAGLASGLVLAPAVAGVSRLVVNWFAKPEHAAENGGESLPGETGAASEPKH